MLDFVASMKADVSGSCMAMHFRCADFALDWMEMYFQCCAIYRQWH